MTLIDLWNQLFVPLIWVVATLGCIAALTGAIKLFSWLMDKWM